MNDERFEVVIHGTIALDEKDSDAFVELVRESVAETLRETGCVHYAVTADLDEAGLFHIQERWECQSDLEAHIEGEAFQAFAAKVSELGPRQRDLTWFRVTDSAPMP
jgi:quinol monooxygenase YgiN